MRHKRFKPVFRSDIPKSEFSLDNAVAKVVEANEIFKPDFIYCDRGLGEYQLEALKLYGMQHPETQLDKKVKGFHFSENIEILDPATKYIVKKAFKHFIIDQTSILLDRNRIMLSPFDNLLYRQFINYNVVKTTQNGTPVFTSVDEHALDAFMLSIAAFVMEMPDIANTVAIPQKFFSFEVNKQNPVSAVAQALFDRVNNTMSKIRGQAQNVDLSDAKKDRPPNIVKHDGNYTNTSRSWAGRGHTSGNNIRRRSF
jgi:hypothetical protein